MRANDTPGTIAATETSLALLTALVDRGEPVGVTEVARDVDTPKGTAHKHLTTLVALGFVERVGGGYRPSPRCLDIGRHAIRTIDGYERIREYVTKLANMTSETAGAVLEHDGTVADVYSAPVDLQRGPYCTTHHPHASAPGKALLAEWADESVATYAAGELAAVTPNTLTDETRLREEISRVRDRGLAFEREEQYEGINSVATAVTLGERMVGVYVAGRANELSGKRFEENVPGILLSVARDLETTT